MAIYHFSANIIKRSAGQSSVARAATCAAEELYDERIGMWHRSSIKPTVIYKGLLLPNAAPDNLRTRSSLWNEVEAVETRDDSQLARLIDVALPDELNAAANIRLLVDYAQSQFVADDIACDVSIRQKITSDDGARLHGYLLTPMRRLSTSGFGLKARDLNGRAAIFSFRESWARAVNEALAGAGSTSTVDHRSNKDRGILHKAAPNVGRVATQMARRGIERERWSDVEEWRQHMKHDVHPT